jgi:hypothetical protein
MQPFVDELDAAGLPPISLLYPELTGELTPAVERMLERSSSGS